MEWFWDKGWCLVGARPELGTYALHEFLIMYPGYIERREKLLENEVPLPYLHFDCQC